MAQLLSIASGNASSSSTWALVDSTSFVSSTETATALTTSRVGATTFTPGAITVAGIAVKLAVRTGTTGTISVDLDQGGSAVSGTTVTINVSDLPVAATADLNGGWHYFKFASPVTLAAATAYAVKCKTSSSSQVSLFATSSSNWCRCLVTTTTQAPAAGDNMIVCGEYLSAGSSNTYTVTWDITATTDFGNTPTAANSLLAPGLCICNKGTLEIEAAAATNYVMKMSNSIIVYSGGVFNMGTVGSEMPRNSTFELILDCGANGDYGVTQRNLGTIIGQGLSRTSGKNIVSCKLNTDEAANSTSLGVDTDTGWLDGDAIVIASTTRSATDCEAGTLNGNAGASTLTVDGFAGTGGGLAVAHSGTAPTQAEIILLTRNIVIRGATASLQGYLNIGSTGTVDFDWVEFKWLGSNSFQKRGIDIATVSGSCSFEYCSIHDFGVNGSIGLNISSASGNNIEINYNCIWNIYTSGLVNSVTTGVYNVTNNIFIRNVANAALVLIADVGINFENNTIVGSSAAYGLLINQNSGVIGSVINNTIHSNTTYGLFLNGAIAGGVLDGFSIWRNNAGGVIFSGSIISNIVIDNFILFGNNTYNIGFVAGYSHNVIISNTTLNGDTTFSTTNGIAYSSVSSLAQIRFINCNFGTASGILTAHTQDIGIGFEANYVYILQNTILASSTEISNQSTMLTGSIITSQKHDQTAGLHKMWKREGTITIETTTKHTGTTSFKMKPISATNKLESSGTNGGFKVAVASGQTCTPTVYVYEDASYNGARAELVLLRNDAIGVTSDTVIDTATSASDAAWEALTGTTISATDDGVMEFVIRCNGTAGNLFVDSFSATVV